MLPIPAWGFLMGRLAAPYNPLIMRWNTSFSGEVGRGVYDWGAFYLRYQWQEKEKSALLLNDGTGTSGESL